VVGDFYRRLGDTDSANKEYREGQARDPKRKTVYQKRIVEAFMARGKAAEAEDINRQILKDNPQDSFAKEVEGSLLLDRGDVADAMVDLQGRHSRPQEPGEPLPAGLAHKARAMSDRSVAAGEIEQARQEFERALALRADFVMARLELARIEIAKGDYEAAMKTADLALKVDRSNLPAKIIESAALLGRRRPLRRGNCWKACAPRPPIRPTWSFSWEG